MWNHGKTSIPLIDILSLNGAILNIFCKNLLCLRLETGLVYFLCSPLLCAQSYIAVQLRPWRCHKAGLKRWLGMKWIRVPLLAPLCDHPRNSTVPVLEFIEYEDWYFVMVPFCDGCYEVPFHNAAEVLDFTEQVLSVGSRLLWFSKICMRFMNTGTMFLAWSLYCTSGGTVHRIWLFSSDYY